MQYPTAPAEIFGIDDNGMIDIWVAPDNIDRAARIYDTLAKEVEQRGWKIGVEEHEKPVRDSWVGYGTQCPPVVHVESHTFVKLFGERIRIELTGKSAQKMRVLTEQEAKQKRIIYIGERKDYWYEPTGTFTLRIVISRIQRSSWTDGKTRTVEVTLNSFFRALIDAAVDLSSAKLEAEAARIRQAEESSRKLNGKSSGDRSRSGLNDWRQIFRTGQQLAEYEITSVR